MKYLVILFVTGFVMMVVVGCGQGAGNTPSGNTPRLDGSDYFIRKVGRASDDRRANDRRADHLLLPHPCPGTGIQGRGPVGVRR